MIQTPCMYSTGFTGFWSCFSWPIKTLLVSWFFFRQIKSDDRFQIGWQIFSAIHHPILHQVISFIQWEPAQINRWDINIYTKFYVSTCPGSNQGEDFINLFGLYSTKPQNWSTHYGTTCTFWEVKMIDTQTTKRIPSSLTLNFLCHPNTIIH